jgi:hypothetical protein
VALIPGVKSTEEALEVLDLKLKQLKHEYEQYFRGTRPRAPVVMRGEVQKIVNLFSNVPIQNTALRFRFNNLCSRFFTFRRQWDTILRQIEEGTYKPHQFKADLHERNRRKPEESAGPPATGAEAARPAAGDALFEEYVTARKSCGEDVKGLTPQRLSGILAEQRTAIQRRFGCKEVRFRVVVEKGRTKLKATPVRGNEQTRSDR